MDFVELGKWLGPSNVTTILISALTGILAAGAGAWAGGVMAKKAAIEGAKKAAEFDDRRKEENERNIKRNLGRILVLEFLYYENELKNLEQKIGEALNKNGYMSFGKSIEISILYETYLKFSYLLEDKVIIVVSLALKNLVEIEDFKKTLNKLSEEYNSASIIAMKSKEKEDHERFKLTQEEYQRSLKNFYESIPAALSAIKDAKNGLEKYF